MPYQNYQQQNQNYENLGVCQFCGAPKMRSQNSGKVYCSSKCWLKNPQPRNYPAQPQYFKNTSYGAPTRDDRIEKMHDEKQESIRWSVALNNACNIVAEMKLNTLEDIKVKINELAQWLYALEPIEKPQLPTSYPNNAPQPVYSPVGTTGGEPPFPNNPF